MFITTLVYIQSFIFAQALDVNDITSIVSVKELTVNGLLMFAIIMLWRRMTAAEEKIDIIRKEKDADNEKYINLLMSTNKIIDENTRMYQRLEKLLDK